MVIFFFLQCHLSITSQPLMSFLSYYCSVSIACISMFKLLHYIVMLFLNYYCCVSIVCILFRLSACIYFIAIIVHTILAIMYGYYFM